MAWSTVSRYRQSPTDVRRVGNDLKVKAVLTGRLLRNANRVVDRVMRLLGLKEPANV